MLLQLTWSRLVWKLQAIIEFLSVNLSDLYNKISLCNISDSCAAKNSKKRQIVQEKGEWICYIYATTRKQNATITFELEFSWFSTSSYIETRAFKINHNDENWNVLPYSTTKMPISILIEKK